MDSDPGGAAEAFRRAADLQPTESRRDIWPDLRWNTPENSRGHRAVSRRARDSPKDYECHFALAALSFARTTHLALKSSSRGDRGARRFRARAPGARQRFAGANEI